MPKFHMDEWRSALAAVRSGDRGAVEQVGQMVTGWARHELCRWKEKDLDADELISDLLADVLPDSFACLAKLEAERVEGYLAATLRNRWHQNLRAKKRRAAREIVDSQRKAVKRGNEKPPALEALAADLRDPERIVLVRLLLREIQATVARMSEVDQQIFRRRFVVEQSLVEIADSLGMPSGTVGRRVHQIRLELETLGEDDVPPCRESKRR